MRKILIPLAVLFLVSCSLKHARFSDASRWIPQTFSPQTHVLLVERFPVAKMNDQMNDYLAKNYPGKYQILDTKALADKSVDYADADKYPFAFMWATEHRLDRSTGSSMVYNRLFVYGYFVNRSENKKYPSTRKYNNYGQKSFIPFFNSIIRYSKNKQVR